MAGIAYETALGGVLVLGEGIHYDHVEGDWASFRQASLAAVVDKHHSSAVLLRYKDEYILAGKQAPVLFGSDRTRMGGRDVTIPQHKYFWRSSLDLKEITGIADLDDNILPIGVL
jgi:hypothetical protein